MRAKLEAKGRELVDANQALEKAQAPGQVEYNQLYRRWQLMVASCRVAILVVLVSLSAWLFRRYSNGAYSPVVYAFAIAVGIKVLEMANYYFPAIYFKYLLIGAALIATIWLLVKLLQMVARPKTDWLLKQYREAYEAFCCPVCDYPIHRGPFKYLFWTRSSIKRLTIPANTSHEPDAPYTCPLCATKLYEECSQCHAIRHSLLPACCHCGSVAQATHERIRS